MNEVDEVYDALRKKNWVATKITDQLLTVLKEFTSSIRDQVKFELGSRQLKFTVMQFL